MTSHKVFLSYSRSDQESALKIVDLLEKNGLSVWWDGLLEGGERFSNTTAEALDNAKAVVVLWSKTSAGSHWVHDEATRGRDSGKLVPVSLDGTMPPLGFGQFQSIDVSKALNRPASDAMQKVVRAVAALEGRTDLPDIEPSQSLPAMSRRNLIIGGAGAAVIAGAITAWQFIPSANAADASSIAVLPFKNLSGDPEQAYFSDGLASEIRTELSRNPLLQIIGQTSSDNFRDYDGDAQAIAKTLGVAFLLDGNVQRSDDQFKMTADLIDGKTGLSKWSEIFERSIEDIFAVQAEIAAAIASALSMAVTRNSGQANDPQVGGTKNVVAFDAYLRGRDLFELHIDESSERAALAKFDEAIAKDPDYAAPRAARARVLAVIANQYAGSAERIKLYDEAVAEAVRATEIAPEFASGFNALGYALFYGKLDVKAARKPYDQAYALAKSDVDVYSRYAIYCARTGRFGEAYSAIEQATKLDPLNASIYRSIGLIKYADKKYEEAILSARKALEINPERNSVHGDIGDSYLALGQLDKARQEYGQEKNDLITFTGKAILEHREGNRAAAQKNFDDLIAEHGDNGLYQQAQILAQWGDVEKTFATLEQAQKLRDSGLVYLLNDPFLDPVRDEPRFKALLLQLGFI